MKKERIFYLDFIRCISVIAIVIFHFNCSIQSHSIVGKEILLTNYVNGSLGQIGVSLFFTISGAALMYTYKENFSTKEFFKKRFISLYPMFWIAYCSAFLYFFYINTAINHSVSKKTFVLTILGMDGYLSYIIPNFYILGEWFLGCIILIYLLFPILRRFVLKNPKTLLICVSIFYIVFVQKYNFGMAIDRNFLNQIPSFLIGMYFVQYIKKLKLYQFIIALIVSLIMLLINININGMYKVTIIGITLFFVLIYIAEHIKIEFIKESCLIISKYSYAIFLVHHVIIEQVLARFNGRTITSTETYCLFIITCIIISIISVYLYKISNNATSYLREIRLIKRA